MRVFFARSPKVAAERAALQACPKYYAASVEVRSIDDNRDLSDPLRTVTYLVKFGFTAKAERET